MTQPEYQRLLQAAQENARDTAIIELLLQTGIRLSELTRFRVEDIELPEETGSDTKNPGAIRINGGASRYSRVVPLNAKACFALAGYLVVRLPVTPVLFLNRFKSPLEPRGIQKIVSKKAQGLAIRFLEK